MPFPFASARLNALQTAVRHSHTVNYKNDVLIDIIEEILPNGELGWEAIAIAYQAKTNEESLQDTTNVKKHWLKTYVMA